MTLDRGRVGRAAMKQCRSSEGHFVLIPVPVNNCAAPLLERGLS